MIYSYVCIAWNRASQNNADVTSYEGQTKSSEIPSQIYVDRV